MSLLGKYQLVRKLATGGMAEVFLAKASGPHGFQKTLVVKRILPHLAEDPQFVEMFLSEAKLAAILNHPNVVQVFDFGEVGGTYFIAMELIDGPNLRALARRARQVGLQISLPIVARIVSLACEGLAYAHSFKDPDTGIPLGLIHRDISPDNILLARNGAVKVVDFGIAKASSSPSLTRSGAIKGKMAYMPPEQLARQPMTHQVDVFALGIVLYELVSGQLPFDASSEVTMIQAIMAEEPLPPVTSVRADVPAALSQAIERALEKDPARRYASCVELQADLESFIDESGERVHTSALASLITSLELPPVKTEAEGQPTPAPREPRATPAGQPRPWEPRTRQLATPVSSSAPKPVAPEPVSEVTLVSDTIASASAFKGERRSPWPLAMTLVGVLGVVGGGAFLAIGRASSPPRVSPERPAVAPVAVPPVVAPPPPVAVTERPEPPNLTVLANAVPSPPKPKASRAPGSISFRVRPYASIYLDGKALGVTPIPSVSVPAGKHKIRLVNEKLSKDEEQEILVEAGKEFVLKANLNPKDEP